MEFMRRVDGKDGKGQLGLTTSCLRVEGFWGDASRRETLLFSTPQDGQHMILLARRQDSTVQETGRKKSLPRG